MRGVGLNRDIVENHRDSFQGADFVVSVFSPKAAPGHDAVPESGVKIPGAKGFERHLVWSTDVQVKCSPTCNHMQLTK